MRFEINRAALVDPAIFAAERERVFERCWLYVGHESEVRAPGDFRTRTICGRPILLCRDSANELRVFLNTCRHRGTVVCREPEGNAERYTCFYHGSALPCSCRGLAARIPGPRCRRAWRSRQGHRR
ncbi:MAG: Rieske (2Fe-2S) protein [Betaproteobacteria bacterium]|nr:MAG: Rieske (2Fe-2S) protein [Betaproteobacteria bacterium]